MKFLLFLLFTIFGAKLHRKFPKVSYIFRAFSFYEIVTWNSWKYFTHYVHIFSKKISQITLFWVALSFSTKARPSAHLFKNENEFNFHVNTISLYMSTKTRFQTEAKGNSELAY